MIQVLIGVAVLLSVVTRFWGIGHELPASYYPDEANFVKRSLAFGSGDLNPHWFHKPAFFMYVLFFEYGVYFVAGKVFGAWGSVGDFALHFVGSLGPFLWIGRVTVAAFSLGALWLVYRMGCDYFGRVAGVASVFLASLTFGIVASSQLVKADVPAMFFSLAAIYWTLKFADGGRWLERVEFGCRAARFCGHRFR